MVKSKLYKRLLVAGITGSLLISSGVVAFAATTKASNSTRSAITSKFAGGCKGEGKGFMQNGGSEQNNSFVGVLKTEVTAGVITQAESDNATAFLKTRTDAEKVTRDAQKAKYAAMTDAQKTADQTAKKVARDAQRAKLNAMTDAQKKAYFVANKPAKVSILSELVTAGIFTQAQADKIQTSMPQRPEIGKGHGKQHGEASIKGANTAVTE